MQAISKTQLTSLLSLSASEQETFLKSLPPDQLPVVIEQIRSAKTKSRDVGRNKYHREYQAAQRSKGREQPPPPEVTNKRLRKSCDKSLYKFGMTCFPHVFYLKPSPDHKKLADEIQSAIENGTKRAIAVQRGFGKTSWCDIAVQWCGYTGRTPMAMLISGNQDEADGLRDGIVTAMETNDSLYGLYPEITHFFRCTAMHGPQLKATFRGVPLRISRRPDIVFPCVPYTGAETCIRVRGIDSKGVRGAHHVRADGQRSRPSIVLLDDPQDDDLARSSAEVTKRATKIQKTIHGLGGPGKSLTVLMPCTPIEKGDLAETFLNTDLTPEYQGIRWPALDSWPDCFDATENNLWTRYFELLAEDQADGLDKHPNATKFYRTNRKKMSAGAAVRWKARVEGHCIDALQSLMNRYSESRPAFMSEMMMAPEDTDGESLYLSDEELAGRFNGLKRRQLPDSVDTLTVAVDVQKRLLYWKTIGWCSTDGKGFIADYGTFPKQPRPQFTHLDAPNTMEKYTRQRVSSGLSWEESLQFCLRELLRELREPLTPGGLRPGVIVGDSRWEKSRTPLLQVAEEEEFSDIFQPVGGLYVGGGDTPISGRNMPRGSRRPSTDVEWYMKKYLNQPAVVLWDANHYRSKFLGGMATPPGQPGSITFFGRLPNRILAEHFGAKQVTKKEGGRREFEEWKPKPGRTQDHWLDCGVMCRVALELLGFRATGVQGKNMRTKTARKKLDPARIAEARQRARRNK